MSKKIKKDGVRLTDIWPLLIILAIESERGG